MDDKLDDLDLQILSAIQFDGRYSNVELAQEIGLSPTPCWNRLRTLEDNGVIERYLAVLDNTKLGYPDTVVIKIAFNCCDEDTSRKFEETLNAHPQVVDISLTAGEYDYYIKVAVTGVEGYERFLRETLLKYPGIRHYCSSFILRCLKQTYSVKIPDTETAPSKAKKRRYLRKTHAADEKALVLHED